MGELDVLGESLGRANCFGAVKGKVQPGEMTYFRVSSDDRNGTLKAYTGEGAFTADPFGMDGGIAVTQVPELRRLMGFVTQNGFEHHVAMVRGHYAGGGLRGRHPLPRLAALPPRRHPEAATHFPQPFLRPIR
ncbi:MAG: hypothetical protein R3D59_07655 [Paracoccaceae bacterium]